MSDRLRRDALGRLVYQADDGEEHTGISAVRAFPITAPEQGIALLSARGEELLWIDSLAQLAAQERQLLAEELASREFTPVITRIRSVSGFATPCSWEVETDRGSTTLVLKSQDDIRRLQNVLLISDKHGTHFLITEPQALDKRSRRLLDRFL